MHYIPTVITQEGRGERAYDIYSRLLKDRIIMINGEIDDDIAASINAQLLFLASEDSTKEIQVYITSPGGSILAGFGILNTMQTVSCDIATTVVGYAASMGAIIASGGTKGKRSALKDAEIMIHQASGGGSGKTSDIKVNYEHQLKLQNKIYDYLSEWTGKSFKQIEKDCNSDCWMSAKDALAYGLIDKILE